MELIPKHDYKLSWEENNDIKTKVAADNILECLKVKDYRKKEEILDLYEEMCERSALNRTERRNSTNDMSDAFRDGVWDLHRRYLIEWTPDYKFFLLKDKKDSSRTWL